MALTWISLFTNQDITQAEFITDFRSRVDEDSADAVTDTQLGRFIRAGLRDIAFRTKLLPEYAEDTPSGSATYALPSGIIQLNEVVYIDTNNNKYLLTPSNLMEIEEEQPADAIPEFYVRNGNNISIYGSSVTTGTIRVYGTRMPTLPVQSTSYIDLPPQYTELLFNWCEWKYWVRRREPDEAAVARGSYFEMARLVAEQVEMEFLRGVSFYGKKS